MKGLTLFFLFSFSSIAGGLYDLYDNGRNYSDFDRLMNEVRFPTSNKQTVQLWIEKLDDMLEKFPDYPQKAAAFYFAGHYSFEQKNYNSAKELLEEAKRLQPDLVSRTPLKKYLKIASAEVARLSRVKVATAIAVGLLALCLCMAFVAGKKGSMSKKVIPGLLMGMLSGVLLLVIWFSVDTSSSATGLEKIYAPPILVKSTLWGESIQLLKLAGYGVLTVFMTIAAVVASLLLKKARIVFSLASAIVFGVCASVIYYNQHCGEVNHTSEDGLLSKRLSFPEKPILWHHEVPEEMMPLYDKDMQDIILLEKEKYRKSKVLKID